LVNAVLKPETTQSYTITLVLTALNVLFGIVVCIFMMGGDLFDIPVEAQNVNRLSAQDLVFLDIFLHPATVVIYTVLFCGVVIYQFNIPTVKMRIIVNLFMLLLSMLLLDNVARIIGFI